VNTSTAIRATTLFVALVCAGTSHAFAGQEVDLTHTFIGLSSPGNVYGPWDIDDLRYIESSLHDSWVIDLSHRSDHDRLFPTSGTYGAISYTRDLSSRWYANAAAGFGSGFPFATSNFHLEADYKATVDQRLVLSAAGDTLNYQNGLHSNDLGIGAAYYWPGVIAQVREYAVTNSNSPTRPSTFASLEIDPSSWQRIVATAIAGPQYYEVITPGIPASFLNTNGYVVTLTYQQWVSTHFGVIVGGYLSDYTQYTTGAPIASGRGLTVGVSVR
jgi:YaiO family outer membrane protein